MVYFSSQDKLNRHPHRASSSDNDSVSSFDRLAHHLQPHEIEILASKARDSRPPHIRHKPHFYTPTRVRRGGSGYKDVNRSASFEHGSLSMYRTSSDGTRRSHKKPAVNDSYEISSRWLQDKKRDRLTPEKTSSSEQPGIGTFSTDDMPPLPPTIAIADVSIDSPIKSKTEPYPERRETVDQIDSLLQSIKTKDNTTPPGGPPMSTPVKDSQSLPSDTPKTDISFDYSDLGSPPHTPYSVTSGNDFVFSSPPPIPVSSPPKEDAVQPLLTTGPVTEGWGPDKNDANIDRNITPRRALDEAFKALNKVGESHLADSGDEPSPITEKKEKFSISEDELSSLYAAVDMTKKRQKGAGATREESDDDEGPPITPYREPPITTTEETLTMGQSANPGYEEIEFGNSKNSSAKIDDGYEDVEFGNKKDASLRNELSINEDTGYARIANKLSIDEDTGYASIENKLSTNEDPGYARVEVVTRRPVSEDLSTPATENVHKASSEDNVLRVERAEVHPPHRASMPPGVLLEDKSPLRTKGSPSRNNK